MRKINEQSSEDFLVDLSVIRFLSSFNFFCSFSSCVLEYFRLSTSLFILVVYDRILPNESVSSLNSLALGVLVAVLFDVILKNAKLRIIEKASVNSELLLTETIFDRYIVQSNINNRQPIGALASVMRELEIYKEFLNTATIAALIDLPFPFFVHTRYYNCWTSIPNTTFEFTNHFNTYLYCPTDPFKKCIKPSITITIETKYFGRGFRWS